MKRRFTAVITGLMLLFSASLVLAGNPVINDQASLAGLKKGKGVLAVTGSTKVGGNYYPLEFHRTLAVGSSWGNAFKSWYNYFGSSDDEWFLGMVILGDPALYIKDGKNIRTLSRNTFSQLVPPDDDSISLMGENLILFDDLYIE